MLLTKGETYNTDELNFLGWNNPNNDDLIGYSAWAYFSDDGTYLGPDLSGIEPEFEYA